MQNTIALLKATQDLVQKGWSQRSEARDFEGRPVPWRDDRASRYSLYAACRRAQSDNKLLSLFDVDSALIALSYAIKREFPDFLGSYPKNRADAVILFNDCATRTVRDCAVVINSAIKWSESL